MGEGIVESGWNIENLSITGFPPTRE